MEDDRPYIIHSPSRITLGQFARELARQHFPAKTARESEILMARFLLDRQRLRDAGELHDEGYPAVPFDAPVTSEEFPGSESVPYREPESRPILPRYHRPTEPVPFDVLPLEDKGEAIP